MMGVAIFKKNMIFFWKWLLMMMGIEGPVANEPMDPFEKKL